MIKNINLDFGDEIYDMLDYLQKEYEKKHGKKIVKSKLIKELIINYNGPVDLQKIIHSTIKNALK